MAEYLWRKVPRSVIRDDNLAYISEQLPHELSYCPWMFYFVATLIADDDGIFDLEDGIVFMRLMKAPNVQTVFQVANLMMQRNIISRSSSKSTKCILVNWEYKEGAKRTMEMRRAAVQRKIQEEQQAKAQNVNFDLQNKAPEETAFNVDFSKNPASENAFFCPDDDKNTKNVVNTERKIDRQIETNKDKAEQERQEREERTDKELEREKETHTESAAGIYCDPLRAERYETEYTENEEAVRQQEEVAAEVLSVSCIDQEQSDPIGEREVSDKSIQAYSILKSFFAKNCLGFNDTEHSKALWDLAFKMEDLSDNKNPVEIVTINFTEQYKKLCENSEFYKNQPILPEYMLKPGSYSHVLAAVSKILMNQSNSNAWQRALQYQLEYEKDLSVGNAFEDQYLKYNIDPKDPHAAVKMLQKLSQQNGTNDP